MLKDFNDWQSTSYISEGQYNNLIKLYELLKYNISIDEYFRNNYNIDDLSKITYQKYYYISKIFEKKIKLSKEQLSIIKKIFSIQDIINILDIHFYEDLRLYDLRKLVKYNSNISLMNMINDKTNIPCKKTKVLKHTFDYEYGIQDSKACLNNEMYYIKFFNIMVLDFDNFNLQEILSILDTNYAYRIYKTYKGYHVFVVSKRIEYNDQHQLLITKQFGADTMYAYYSYYNGYNIRLSPKIGYNEEKTHQFVMDYGKQNIDNEILSILKNTIDNENIETNNFFYDKYLALEYPDIPKVPSTFIDYLLKSKEITYENIIDYSKFFINYIKKPQRYLYFDDDLYLGIDMNTNIHYICYNDILMIDIDSDTYSIPEQYKDDSFYVYKSANGFHIFLMNRRITYGTKESIEYMINFKCDPKYIICSYLRGYSVRINSKNSDEKIYELIDIHNEPDFNILEQVEFHIEMSNKFWN